MKKIYLIISFLSIFVGVKAQQWDWAVTADSVYGNQETKMICKNNTNLFALIYQDGPSVINSTYLDSGYVIAKINLAGQIQWAKHYPGNIKSIYANNSGTIYFIGVFSGSLNFLNTNLISNGGIDIFYGELDAAGNKLWVNSAGGLQNDQGNGIISDAQGNIFLAGQIKDSFYVGTQSLPGVVGLNTYLLRCGLAGNYIAAYPDSTGTISNGLYFQKDINGNLFLCNKYYTYPCPYICGGTNVIKIDPLNYSLTIKAQFFSYGYQDLHSWTVNNDSTISANYNTGSHYMTTYNIYKVTTGNVRTFRKDMGSGYDGKMTPFITRGTGNEIITGGMFFNNVSSADTLWYDNFSVTPDTTRNIIMGGVDSSNQYTWLLYSEGESAPLISALISDEQGNTYCAGNYNNHPYWLPQDSLPEPVIFGNTVLPSENKYTRFFVAEAETTLGAQVQVHKIISTDFSVFPNPSSGNFTISSSKNISSIEITNLIGEKIYSASINSKQETIHLSSQPRGIYFVEMILGSERSCRKIIIE